MSATRTYRQLLDTLIGETIHEAVGGSPWIDEFQDAFDDFVAKIDAAFVSTPSVAEVLNEPIRGPRLVYLPHTVMEFLREPEPLPF